MCPALFSLIVAFLFWPFSFLTQNLPSSIFAASGWLLHCTRYLRWAPPSIRIRKTPRLTSITTISLLLCASRHIEVRERDGDHREIVMRWDVCGSKYASEYFYSKIGTLHISGVFGSYLISNWAPRDHPCPFSVYLFMDAVLAIVSLCFGTVVYPLVPPFLSSRLVLFFFYIVFKNW